MAPLPNIPALENPNRGNYTESIGPQRVGQWPKMTEYTHMSQRQTASFMRTLNKNTTGNLKISS